MTATRTNVLPLIQPDGGQANNAGYSVAALQGELAMLRAKVETYYQHEIVLRGDKNMMREYCGYFDIHPASPVL
jgi:hypothetical protein